MQSTEMKPQNGTVGIGETSREGYMELNRIHIEEKGKIRRLKRIWSAHFQNFVTILILTYLKVYRSRKNMGNLRNF